MVAVVNDVNFGGDGLAEFLRPYPLEFLHSSGHASPEDVASLINCVDPRSAVIPIHTDAPEVFQEMLPGRKMCLLEDGERVEGGTMMSSLFRHVAVPLVTKHSSHPRSFLQPKHCSAHLLRKRPPHLI